MKSTGIVRKVDELGRVVIPIELRRTLNLQEKDSVEIFVDKDAIILKKYKANMECAMTGEVSERNMTLLQGHLVLSKAGAEALVQEITEKLKG